MKWTITQMTELPYPRYIVRGEHTDNGVTYGICEEVEDMTPETIEAAKQRIKAKI